MIGTKVRLEESYAKWHLDHPEIYYCGSKVSDCFEEETLIHLICCLGEPVYGKIISVNERNYETSYRVKFKISNLSMSYWVEKSHVEFLP